MNTKENKEIWIKKVEEILMLGGKSSDTIKTYKYGILHFLNYFSDDTNISEFVEEDILKYLKTEYIDKGKASSTYNFYLHSIKFFYSVCFKKSFTAILLPTSKLGKKLPVIIKKETFLELVNKEKNLEHKCWLLLSFCCGLRTCEIATLKIEYIESSNHKLKVLGKGNKERYTVLPDIVIKYLRLFYKSRKMTSKEGYLFKGMKERAHINKRIISNYFTNLKKHRNVPNNITFHALRHSFATYFLMNNGDPFILKDLLGHNSLSTTAIYIHLAKDFDNLKGINYHGK
ncbi:MAG: tyrosine-type recombinase/integrase [Erysipelotrichaceae bacterium]|nr:tyrosine-type recombinase/integrase [Erysipelotrichaceae bacterium]